MASEHLANSFGTIARREPEVFRTAEMAIKSTHEILIAAIREKLDVWMLCGSLHEELWQEYYSGVNDSSFTEVVSKILRAGNDVSIFLWNDPVKNEISPELLELVRCEKNHKWGKLRIYASGTTERAQDVTHFVLAKSRDDHTWILRIEQPHPARESIDIDQGEVVSVVLWNTAVAKKHGVPLLQTFEHLVGLIRDKAHHAGNPATPYTAVRHAM